MDVKQLGVYMREKRIAEKKTLRQVAKFIKIDPAILSRFERGLRVPTTKTLNKICEYLQVDVKLVSSRRVARYDVRREKEPHTVTCDRCLARKQIWV